MIILCVVTSMKVYPTNFNNSTSYDLMYLDKYAFYMPPFGGIRFFGVYNCTEMYDYVPGKGWGYYVTDWELVNVVSQSASSVSSVYTESLSWYTNIEGPMFGTGISDDYTLTYVIMARLRAESTIIINGFKISVINDVVLNGAKPCWC